MAATVVATVAPISALDFESAVREHQAMVLSLAYHFLRDRALAEELAQDVFLQLHLHWEEMRSPEQLRFWLAGSAHSFATGRLGVVQMLLAKWTADAQALVPRTRADIYAAAAAVSAFGG